MQRGNIAEKGANISWAISIIEGMRASLDLDAGGDIARNLNDLYDYMGRRLLEANMRNDAKALDEVMSLLREIKTGWDAIPGLLGKQ
jgi:flagellar protein FliS